MEGNKSSVSRHPRRRLFLEGKPSEQFRVLLIQDLRKLSPKPLAARRQITFSPRSYQDVKL